MLCTHHVEEALLLQLLPGSLEAGDVVQRAPSQHAPMHLVAAAAAAALSALAVVTQIMHERDPAFLS